MNHFRDIFYESKLNAFSLFLFVSIMACNVFAFSISGGGSEASYKETEKRQ